MDTNTMIVWVIGEVCMTICVLAIASLDIRSRKDNGDMQ